MTLVERFLDYVSYDTQSDEETNMTPSTPGQMILMRWKRWDLKRFPSMKTAI